MNELSLLISTLCMLPKVWKAKVITFLDDPSLDISKWARSCLDMFNNNIKFWLIKWMKEPFSDKVLDETFYRAKNIAEKTEKLWINMINCKEENFPEWFKKMISDAPVLLYYKWDISKINRSRSITVIWSREADDEWLKTSFFIWKHLASKWYNIVSWLAKWCDMEAHKWALSVGWFTTAIVWCWLDSITTNKELSEEILNKWWVILSEYSIGVKDASWSLVARDKLQAWLSDTIIWVQFSRDSWTTHAIMAAIWYKKKLYVVKYKNQGNSKITSWNAFYLEHSGAEELTSNMIDSI